MKRKRRGRKSMSDGGSPPSALLQLRSRVTSCGKESDFVLVLLSSRSNSTFTVFWMNMLCQSEAFRFSVLLLWTRRTMMFARENAASRGCDQQRAARVRRPSARASSPQNLRVTYKSRTGQNPTEPRMIKQVCSLGWFRPALRVGTNKLRKV